MALSVVTLSLVFRAISSKLIPLVWRIDATLQLFRGNVAMPAPVFSIGPCLAMLQGWPTLTKNNLVLSPEVWRVRVVRRIRARLTIGNSDSQRVADWSGRPAVARRVRPIFLESAAAAGALRRQTAHQRTTPAPAFPAAFPQGRARFGPAGKWGGGVPHRDAGWRDIGL